MAILTRRRWIGTGIAASAMGVMHVGMSKATDDEVGFGQVVGDPEAARVGSNVLRNGGNAIDAIVAGSFAAAVTAVGHTGIGGYGGAATIALEGGRKLVSIDFNSTAPAALRGDSFPLDKQGNVIDRANEFGWRSAGVPGVLAGLALTLKTGGTWTLRDTLQPAIVLARDGFIVSTSLATAIGRGNYPVRQRLRLAQTLFRPGRSVGRGQNPSESGTGRHARDPIKRKLRGSVLSWRVCWPDRISVSEKRGLGDERGYGQL